MDRPRLILKPLQIPDLPASLDIEEAPITLGRDHDNMLVFGAERFPHVSGHHARIAMAEDGPIVEDLGSKNGTLLNGHPVERAALVPGDVIQLGGHLGPRLLVTTPLRSDTTLSLTGEGAALRNMGASTLLKVRNALGLPERERELQLTLRSRERRLIVVFVLALFILCLGGYLAFRSYDRGQQKSLADLLEKLNRSQMDGERQRRSFEEQKRLLEKQQEALSRKIQEIEKKSGSADEIAGLQKELTATEQRLERFSPVNLEKEQNERLAAISRAVVFVEAKVEFRDGKSGKLLHVDESGASPTLSLDQKGDPFTQEGSGSGFCVSPDGWIITNAHVAKPPEFRKSMDFGGWKLQPEIHLAVVFSGESEPRPARVVRLEAGDDVDLALLKIAPFEGMPAIREFDPDVPPPPPGSEVLLFGFPLGKHALQKGNEVVASMFKGILSRRVDPFLQVDAGVHPGNSGGPLIDRQGRIIGVVTAVQVTPQGTLATEMGYAIPIGKAKRIWPPP